METTKVLLAGGATIEHSGAAITAYYELRGGEPVDLMPALPSAARMVPDGDGWRYDSGVREGRDYLPPYPTY